MCSADNGIKMHYRHDPIAIAVVIQLKDPQAVVWVQASEALAELVDECTFEQLLPEHKQKNRCTLATPRPLTPAISDLVSRRMQSWQGAVMSLVFHFGVHQIILQYSPPMPDMLLGAQKVALAEWNMEMSLIDLMVGQAEMGGVPVKVGFC
jgi:hypothetical protein